MYLKDTVEFDANAMPNFLTYAPHHPSVVPLLKEEQKQQQRQFSTYDCTKQGISINGMCSLHHQEKVRGKDGGTNKKTVFY